jgi:hypothetical protein
MNICDKCGRYDDVHIGKSSAGWKFTFQFNGGKFYKTMPQMKEWLSNKVIVNEYNEEISHEYFWKIVKEKQKEGKDNIEVGGEKLIDGYVFYDREFS